MPAYEAVRTNQAELHNASDSVNCTVYNHNINNDTGSQVSNITRVLSSNGNHISGSAWLRNRDANSVTTSDVNDTNDQKDNDNVYIPSV